MKNYKIKTNFGSPETNKTGINFMAFIVIAKNAKYDFSVWLITGSNQADIKWIWIQSEKLFKCFPRYKKRTFAFSLSYCIYAPLTIFPAHLKYKMLIFLPTSYNI